MNLFVYITVPEAHTARRLALDLVESHLAAGVNVAGPINSVYRWEGSVHQAQEWQLFVQTARYEELEDFVRKRHPHFVPCIIGFSIACGNKNFLDWIAAGGEERCVPQS